MHKSKKHLQKIKMTKMINLIKKCLIIHRFHLFSSNAVTDETFRIVYEELHRSTRCGVVH